MKVIYAEGSETIRQMPENYLLAHRRDGRWLCEPDLAADRKLAVKVFKAILSYEVKYGNGEVVLAAI